jgi:hypothetical protein
MAMLTDDDLENLAILLGSTTQLARLSHHEAITVIKAVLAATAPAKSEN